MPSALPVAEHLRIKREKLLSLALRLPLKETHTATKIPGFFIFKETKKSSIRSPLLTQPVISLTLQGRKSIIVSNEEYEIQPNSLIIHSSNLPILCQVEEASVEKPYLALGCSLDKSLLAELLLQMPEKISKSTKIKPISSSEASEMEMDAFEKLLSLALEPEKIPLLSPIYKKTLLAYLLLGQHSDWLREIQSGAGHTKQILGALSFIQENYAQEINVDTLASRQGMSPASFFRHFKLFSGTTPTQYLKSLRLHKAKELLLTTDLSIASAAYSVGYKSSSQFSNDYKKFFHQQPSSLLKN